MKKPVQDILGRVSAETLVQSSSLPLMGADVAPKKCAGMKKKPIVDDQKLESKCAGMKKKPALDDTKARKGAVPEE